MTIGTIYQHDISERWNAARYRDPVDSVAADQQPLLTVAQQLAGPVDEPAVADLDLAAAEVRLDLEAQPGPVVRQTSTSTGMIIGRRR
jgi:hypothetical protein